MVPVPSRALAAVAALLCAAGCTAPSAPDGAAAWSEAVVVAIGRKDEIGAGADRDCSPGVAADAPYMVVRVNGGRLRSRSWGWVLLPSADRPALGDDLEIDLSECARR